MVARYNSLFRHLLRLKRVSMELDAAWGCLEGWTSRMARRQRTQQPLWLLRYHAAYHINNLLAYMQARCALKTPFLIFAVHPHQHCPPFPAALSSSALKPLDTLHSTGASTWLLACAGGCGGGAER